VAQTLPVHLLAVDDEMDILNPIKLGLQRQNFHVDTFTNPLEALANFSLKKYNVALLDISMPQMDGFNLGKELLKIDHELKICFLTGFANMEDRFRTEFPHLSIESFLQKPVSISSLSNAIKKLLFQI